MNFEKEQWLGNWQNFEEYMNGKEPALNQVWKEAEEAASSMPMFQGGVLSFWKKACRTVTDENSAVLGGWKITSTRENELQIEWLDGKRNTLYCGIYHLQEIIEKGLEGKKNFLFVSEDECPFRYLLAMEPMPERGSYRTGGLLSHLHFQYAGKREELLDKKNSLLNPMWYATMCEDEGTLLDRCNIILAMHRLPLWKQLPKKQDGHYA